MTIGQINRLFDRPAVHWSLLLGGCWGPPTSFATGGAGGRGAVGDTAAAAELHRATAAAAAAGTSLPFPLRPCSFSSSSFPFPPDFVHFLYLLPGSYVKA